MNRKIKIFSAIFLFLVLAPVISMTLFLGVAGLTLFLSVVLLAVSVFKAILDTTVGAVLIAAIVTYITTRNIQKRNAK